MPIELKKTKDGSYTLFIPALNEHYHSYNGALAEAMHIFINAGFNFLPKQKINILELGFGTGLNAILTFTEAKKNNTTVFYCAVEAYPLDYQLIKQLKYESLEGVNPTVLKKIHTESWEKEIKISKHFTLQKLKTDIQKFEHNKKFDLVYFDAFAPEVQPVLWSEKVFINIHKRLKKKWNFAYLLFQRHSKKSFACRRIFCKTFGWSPRETPYFKGDSSVKISPRI